MCNVDNGCYLRNKETLYGTLHCSRPYIYGCPNLQKADHYLTSVIAVGFDLNYRTNSRYHKGRTHSRGLFGRNIVSGKND